MTATISPVYFFKYDHKKRKTASLPCEKFLNYCPDKIPQAAAPDIPIMATVIEPAQKYRTVPQNQKFKTDVIVRKIRKERIFLSYSAEYQMKLFLQRSYIFLQRGIFCYVFLTKSIQPVHKSAENTGPGKKLRVPQHYEACLHGPLWQSRHCPAFAVLTATVFFQ